MSLRSSGTCCAVRGCTNHQRKLNLWLDEQCFKHAPRTKRDCSRVQRYSFHRLPTDDEARRMWLKTWIWRDPRKHCLCVHFISSTKCQRRKSYFVARLRQTTRKEMPQVHKRIDSSARNNVTSGMISGVVRTENYCICPVMTARIINIVSCTVWNVTVAKEVAIMYYLSVTTSIGHLPVLGEGSLLCCSPWGFSNFYLLHISVFFIAITAVFAIVLL